MDATSSSRSSRTLTDRRLSVARVIGPKGLKGAVRIELLTDWPERLAPGAQVWLEGASEPMRIERVESGGRTTVLHLEGVGSRDAAGAVVGRYLEMPAHELPEGSFFWDELIGLQVEDAAGRPLGELVEIFRAGGNEVYRVVGPPGETLVPALRSVVTDVDLDAGRMVVDLQEPEEVG